MSALRYHSWLAGGLALAAAVMAPAAKGNTVEWMIDPGQQLTVTEIASRSDWQPWDGRSYLQAKSGEALWLRVTLRNPGDKPLLGVLQDTEIYVDRVEAWLEGKNQPATEWRHEVSGALLPLWERPLWGWTSAFLVEVPAGGEQVVYLRETDYYSPRSWWRWWPRMEDYFSDQLREGLVKALCVGALAALWIYNLVLWARLRFPDMGYYVGYAAAMLVFNVAESGGSNLLGSVLPAPLRLALEAVALSASALFVITFARLFLETAKRLPRLDRGLRGLFYGWLVVLGGACTMPWLWPDFWLGTAILGVSATHLVLLGVAMAAWVRGFRAARFFVLAFGVLSLGGVPAALTWGGGGNTQIMVTILLVASTLEMLLLSFAIADRFAQAQQQLAEETEHRRLLQETYADELAEEVSERTRELELANADKDRMLAVIGHDLRSPLTGLMRSADDAGGDFAREVSRIGRMLLLLIEDLVLWARLRAGVPVIASHEARAVAGPAVSLHRTIAEHEEIELVVEMPEGLRVRTDLVLAQTLVRNILANALKFAQTQVVLRAEPTSEGVRFSVINDGPPLSPEVAARLSANADEPATAGLGLRLCREICRRLGVRLQAHSGETTTFYFTLPPAPAEERT